MRHAILLCLLAACNACHAPPADTPQDPLALASRISQTVRVESGHFAGSGVNLGNGRVLTAFHVVAGTALYTVTDMVTDKSVMAELDLTHRFDIARLELHDSMPGPPVSVARVAPGEIVCSMVAHPEFIVRCGHVTSVQDEIAGIRHTVPVAKGNSGGGLYNEAGDLVGIVVTCNLTDDECDGSGGGASPVASMPWLVD